MKWIHLLFLATGLIPVNPVFAFGSPAEAGAVAWCGARSKGASIDEANKQLRKTMASEIMMSTGFAAGLVGIINNRQGLQSQIDFHISKMCPEHLNEGINSGINYNPNNVTTYSTCAWNPWLKECGGQDRDRTDGKEVVSEVKTIPPKYAIPGIVGIDLTCISAGKVSQAKCDEIIIERIAPGSPADLDGRLRKGDKIIEVNGQRLTGKTKQNILQIVKGEAGTHVTTVIEVNGSTRTIILRREAAKTTNLQK